MQDEPFLPPPERKSGQRRYAENLIERITAQLEEKKKQINAMIQILDDGLNCQCLTWSECFGKIKTTGTCS